MAINSCNDQDAELRGRSRRSICLTPSLHQSIPPAVNNVQKACEGAGWGLIGHRVGLTRFGNNPEWLSEWLDARLPPRSDFYVAFMGCVRASPNLTKKTSGRKKIRDGAFIVCIWLTIREQNSIPWGWVILATIGNDAIREMIWQSCRLVAMETFALHPLYKHRNGCQISNFDPCARLFLFLTMKDAQALFGALDKASGEKKKMTRENPAGWCGIMIMSPVGGLLEWDYI